MYLRKTLIIVLLILLVDQISKIYVKTHFQLEESVEVFSWFRISFIENPGAAWGTKLSDILPISESTGKLMLTLFRLIAIGGIGYWLWDLIRKGANSYLRVAVSLIFAGAVGNIIDSLFLWTDFRSQCRTSCHIYGRRQLWGPFLREGGRYAVFPNGRYYLAGLGAMGRRESFPVFCPGFQYRGYSYKHRGRNSFGIQ